MGSGVGVTAGGVTAGGVTTDGVSIVDAPVHSPLRHLPQCSDSAKTNSNGTAGMRLMWSSFDT